MGMRVEYKQHFRAADKQSFSRSYGCLVPVALLLSHAVHHLRCNPLLASTTPSKTSTPARSCPGREHPDRLCTGWPRAHSETSTSPAAFATDQSAFQSGGSA